MNDILEFYQIEKQIKVRQYKAIPEQPMGKQFQVDWGETRQKTIQNKEVKLYFIAFVLAHSRLYRTLFKRIVRKSQMRILNYGYIWRWMER